MKHAVSLFILGLTCGTIAAGGDSAGCGLSPGLYDGWLGTKVAPARGNGVGALVAGGSKSEAAPDKQIAIGKQYRAFFRCLSDAVERQDKSALAEKCKEVEGDRIASLACHTAIYLKSGRSQGKEFLDSLPAKKGMDSVWDLEAIGGKQHEDTASIFLPSGPAYKLLDELFLLVLDDQETAAAKYMGIAALAPVEATRHIDEQLKLLIHESPAVVVKRWMVFRQYQPKFKKVLAEMSASLSAAEMQKMRKGFGAFCANNNPDCPEIARLIGKFQ